MNYPPEPYPPCIQDSWDDRSTTRMDSLLAISVTNNRVPGPSCSHSGDDSGSLPSMPNPSEKPRSPHGEEAHTNEEPAFRNGDTPPELVLPSMLQAPAEIFHGSRNPSALIPGFYSTQDSLPSTPSSYSASPKTPAQSQHSFSSPKIAEIEAGVMIGLKRPHEHISFTPSHDQPIYHTSAPKNILKSRSVVKTPLRHRPTPASVAESYQKLSTPFRSPMLIKSPISNINARSSSQLSKRPKIFNGSGNPAPHNTANPVSTDLDVKSDAGVEAKPEPKELKRIRIPSKETISGASQSASKPFRSPLLAKRPSAVASGSHSSGMEKRTIQTLEKKLHLLRQAKKIRLARTTESLEADARKWKCAARQAAEELWSLVQSNSSGGMGGGSTDNSNSYSSVQDSHQNNSFSNSYEWATTDADDRGDDVLAHLKGGGFEASWGWADATSNSSGSNQPGYHAEECGERHPQRYEEESTSEPPSPSTLLQQMFRPYRRRGDGTSKLKEWKSVIPEDDKDGADYEEIGNELPAGSGKNDLERDEDKEPERVEHNVGTMLVSFGIDAKGTLGWDDAEGDFVDS